MATYHFKQYRREFPEQSNVGVLICQFSVKAGDDQAALAVLPTWLVEYDEATDFAVVIDHGGRPIWQRGIHA